jgi:acetoin utilization protein AcuB
MEPIINDYMTPLLHRLEPRATLTEAKALMAEHGIRHLPVIDRGEVVGIITMSDLYVLEALLDVETDDLTASDVMSEDVYTVQISARLGDVARGMAERHVGSAIVLEGSDPVGIFTATDGLKALAQILDRR